MRPILVLAALYCGGFLVGCSDKTTDGPPPDGPVIHVPAEAPTLMAALAVAEDGDTIQVAGGLFRGDGNRDLTIPNRDLVIRSASGAAATILDGQGDANDHHFLLSFENVRSNVIIDGFTFRGAFASHGAVRCKSASPTFENCIFVDNHATVSGGALRCKSASPLLRHCTFSRNSATAGAGLFLIAGASPILENCVISFSGQGGAVYSSDGTSVPTLTCCDLFANAGGDWVDRIADQAGTGGNFSADPLFCRPEDDDVRIDENSPCAPANNECGQLVGAGEVGCP
jgi:predicted outer membrane repeat protein